MPLVLSHFICQVTITNISKFDPCFQWNWPGILFVIYRLALAIYSTIIVIFSIVKFDHGKWHRPWPVWLTNWSYFILTCHLLCSATVTLLFTTEQGRCLRRRERHRSSLHSSEHQAATHHTHIPWYLKLDWFLFNIASSAAILVTVVYFSALFPQRDLHSLSAEDANLHMMNTVLIILELCISAIPVRLLHFIYMWLYGAIYIAFTAIYWAFDHSVVLYPKVLDWNHPGQTALIVFGLAVVGVPILQLVIFVAYRFRLFIYDRMCESHGAL